MFLSFMFITFSATEQIITGYNLHNVIAMKKNEDAITVHNHVVNLPIGARLFIPTQLANALTPLRPQHQPSLHLALNAQIPSHLLPRSALTMITTSHLAYP